MFFVRRLREGPIVRAKPSDTARGVKRKPERENVPERMSFDSNKPRTMALAIKPGGREIAGKERLRFSRELLK
jgi:hypothetical protein